MQFGRSAIQSNVIAPFMLQQHRRMASSPTALRHARTSPRRTFGFFLTSPGRVSLAARHVPFPGPLGGQYDDTRDRFRTAGSDGIHSSVVEHFAGMIAIGRRRIQLAANCVFALLSSALASKD